MTTLKRLLADAYPGETRRFDALPDVPVAGIECDSRRVGRGYLFLAVRGVKTDGGAFIEEALRRGASVVAGESRPHGLPDGVPYVSVPEGRDAAARLASAFYGHPSRRLSVVGITGTNGKTTSSYVLERILEGAGRPTGVIGTVSYRFAGVEEPAAETTPGPLRLQEILSRMAEKACEFAVMEVSSHALDQNRAGGIDFKAALFTNLTQDHLDYHKTMQAYFDSKKRLFEGLSSDAASVMNADDEWGRKLAGAGRGKPIWYGTSDRADVRASEVRSEGGRTRFGMSVFGRRIQADVPLVGLHNVYNVLGAVGTAAALGLDPARAAASLADFAGVPGRLERVDGGQDFLVYIDFAHTPDGLENVLRALRPAATGRLIAVFGCGGDRDPGKRPRMGGIASRLADRLIVTSDNPRSEDPRAIADAIVSGFEPGYKNYAVVLDRKKAIRQAFLEARAGDVVLLAGKGHERAQIIGDRAIPFSDIEEARRILRGH